MDSSASMQVYDFHELRLGCLADDEIAAALATRLGRFTRLDPGSWDARFDYRRVEVESELPYATPDADARLIYESPMGQVHYSDRQDRIRISSVWPIRAVCEPEAGETTICVAGPVEEHLWALSHPLLTIPLMETLKRRGRFSIHAAGVARGGKGLLIPGSSGSGKSTLALALARAGFGFLGDDMLFLSRAGDEWRAHAFPEAFDLTDQTVRLFPDLADLLATEKQPGWPKRQLYVDERFGAPIVWECRPAVLVFPRVAGVRQSTITAMDRGEALHELLPNILLTESSHSQRHLDALADLAASAACYRLETGTDFEELAAKLDSLLEST